MENEIKEKKIKRNVTKLFYFDLPLEEFLKTLHLYSCRYQELHAEYHGRGERTVKETADLVGFKLPHDPR